MSSDLLNKEQKKAVETINGPLLVLAGAGTGKTRVITYRIANMLRNWIAPENILALTFTNKAAREMKERVAELVNKDSAKKLFIGTFHAFSMSILKKETKNIKDLHSGFTIADEIDQKSIFKQIIAELGYNDNKIDINVYRSIISNAKNNLLTSREFKLQKTGFFDKIVGNVYEKYQNQLILQNMVDFDDILLKVVKLWQEKPEILKKYQDIYKYILVDEFQDTNHVQFTMIRLLTGKNNNICVVGDDDQCILPDSKIQLENNVREIQNIKENSNILSACGNSETIVGNVEKVLMKNYHGKVIKVTTATEKTLTATPNHITFARLNPEPGKYYVYLMYKNGKGYRIGQTQGVRSRKNEIINDLQVRINQENADKIWILKSCDSKEEASYYEQLIAFQYGIPTTVFHAYGRRISLTQEQINNLFKEINTEERAEKLFSNEIIFKEYPHSIPNAVIRGKTSRRIINVSYFGGRKTSKEKGWYSHRISLNTTGNDIKDKAKNKGFAVRNGNRNTWRVETERTEYDKAKIFADNLSFVNDDLLIFNKIKLVKDQRSFMFMPFGNLSENMSIPIFENGKIIEDKIVKIEVLDYNGPVYDLSVPNIRQYIANGIVIHNSIYGWRGAKIENILNFPKNFKGTETIKLEQNYRSTNNILKAANLFIAGNKNRHEKNLWSKRGEGERILVHQTETDQEEANFITGQIHKLICENPSLKYKDIAVLYRSNHQSRLFESSFRNDAVPYRLVGSKSFYERKEIRDAAAYLKLCVNNRDDQSFLRIIGVPPRGIGQKAIENLRDIQGSGKGSLCNILGKEEFKNSTSGKAAATAFQFSSTISKWTEILKTPGDLADKVKNYFYEIGFLNGFQKMYKNIDEADSRKDNVIEFISAIAQYEKDNGEEATLNGFLETFCLSDDNDKVDEDKSSEDAVTLLTVHSAKGLEFPYVFLVGMEQELFPNYRAIEEGNLDEERRLFYVAITRAKDKLIISHSRTRFKYGRAEYQVPSCFLEEIPEELIEQISEKPIDHKAVSKAFEAFYKQFT